MGVNLDAQCDGCRNNLSDGDDTYCSDCYQKLKDKIETLEEEIETLEEENAELTTTLEDCQANCNSCTHRYVCVAVKGKDIKSEKKEKV